MLSHTVTGVSEAGTSDKSRGGGTGAGGTTVYGQTPAFLVWFSRHSEPRALISLCYWRGGAGSHVAPALPWTAQRLLGTGVGALSCHALLLPEQQEKRLCSCGGGGWRVGGTVREEQEVAGQGGGHLGKARDGAKVCVEPLGSSAPQNGSRNLRRCYIYNAGVLVKGTVGTSSMQRHMGRTVSAAGIGAHHPLDRQHAPGFYQGPHIAVIDGTQSPHPPRGRGSSVAHTAPLHGWRHGHPPQTTSGSPESP